MAGRRASQKTTVRAHQRTSCCTKDFPCRPCLSCEKTRAFSRGSSATGGDAQQKEEGRSHSCDRCSAKSFSRDAGGCLQAFLILFSYSYLFCWLKIVLRSQKIVLRSKRRSVKRTKPQGKEQPAENRHVKTSGKRVGQQNPKRKTQEKRHAHRSEEIQNLFHNRTLLVKIVLRSQIPGHAHGDFKSKRAVGLVSSYCAAKKAD